MDYGKTAANVLELVGGKENLISAAHCATRLRLVIADNKKCSKEKLENVAGVKGVFEASGQLQIIFGTGTVNKVYDEFIQLAHIQAATKEEAKKAAASKANVFQRFIKMLGDIFVPIIPAIVASGFLMGIMNTLDFMNSNGVIAIDTSGSLYVFATLFANTAYTFLPILIAVSAAKVFGGNPFLGAVIGMIMIHPDLQNAWTVATEGVQHTQEVFGGLYSIDMVGYQGHVIPVIIAVWVMCMLEKWLHKIVPAMLDLFVTPLVSVFVTGYLTLAVIGPVFVTVENGVLGGVQWLISVPFGIGSFIMGALYAPTVVMGIHHMYTIIDLGQLSMYGMTFWLPLASAANIAQGAACLSIGIKSKKAKNKSLCLPSALSAFMGITEPAIFGVNIRFFRPFLAGCIGGACGAMYASIAHLGASGTGVTGIFGILLCLNMPVSYIIMFVISAGVAFGVSWIITPRKLIDGEESVKESEETEVAEQTDEEEIRILSPLQGETAELSETGDETFASGALGEGIAIRPGKGEVVAPCRGTISVVMGHAIGIFADNGAELLIHVGIDTVELNGKYFDTKVEEGERVEQGQLLMTFDIQGIASEGYQVITPVLVTNSDEYNGILFEKKGTVKAGDPLIRIKNKKEG
ncbi:MAG TPA: glucose PTS transporter subunit IIA [Candidatus Eubacterium avistercoris]|uniref:Glucose PTS transporter subunit IIA n=1 Tax=Candidatus Eubacterium avistercoris TaxID=2838567 RepID=A0A9D2IES6_9FIRM|nr:glucose PTS transporter subunit IIA [Candidatus Eubacterium avistercoris]